MPKISQPKCMHASRTPSPCHLEHRQQCRHGAYAAHVQSLSELQERAESRKGSGLCHSLVRGVPCHFGERCRFNHDVEAFLQTKGPELPGCCPFLSVGTCAYGGTAAIVKIVSWRSELRLPGNLCSTTLPVRCNSFGKGVHASQRACQLSLD